MEQTLVRFTWTVQSVQLYLLGNTENNYIYWVIEKTITKQWSGNNE